ncbi:MAG: hypothetical protein M3Q79_02490 [bacterium]|nr:hypothetical protein [bacterium]
MQNDEEIEHIDLRHSDPEITAGRAHVFNPSENYQAEYLKLTGILLAILFGAFMHYTTFDLTGNGFLDSFMGVFFLTFASFKLIGLTEFVTGFATYDVVAKKYPAYGYVYPFTQLMFAVFYLVIGASRLTDILVLVVSLVSAYGVVKALNSKRQFHCVCLGNVIKLPLSRISFIEDFGMATMALVMLIMR